MANETNNFGLGALLNALFGKQGMSGPGATRVNADAPYYKYGELPPSYGAPSPKPSFGNTVAPLLSSAGLFEDKGVDFPSDTTPSMSAAPPPGALSQFFPDGNVPMQQDALSPGMTKGLNSLTPIMLAAGLLPLTQRGTGRRPVVPGHVGGGTMNWPMPSENLAKLIMAQRRG